MENASSGQNTLGPLILRIVLGIIFIYHGLDKITGKENDWGASWAGTLWNQRGKTPQEVVDKVDQMAGESDERKAEIITKLQPVYGREAQNVPESLRYAASQFAVAWGELVGGVALILGCLTRLAALGLIVIQAGAVATVTWGKGFSFLAGGGYEYNLALLAMCLALALEGAGPLSVDACLKSRRRGSAHAAAPGTA
jgi:uncharacterized membrane protein YphA (DoxX/SURF4 family)